MNSIFADGNWLLWRAYSTMGKSSSAPEKRIPNMLLDWFSQAAVRFECTAGSMCFDGHRVFRYQLYSEYKLNRHKEDSNGEVDREASDMIHSLIPITMNLFKEHGIHSEQKAEYEADDLLTSGSYSFESQGKVILLARDKDQFQNIRKNVVMYTPPMGMDKEKIWTPETVKAAKGMTPKQFLRYQILLGDATDNIPPIPRVGTPAAAKDIVTRFNRLSDFFKTAVGKRVYAEYASEIARNRQLVTMVKTAWTEKDIKFKLVGANPRAPAFAALKSSLSKRSLF